MGLTRCGGLPAELVSGPEEWGYFATTNAYGAVDGVDLLWGLPEKFVSGPEGQIVPGFFRGLKAPAPSGSAIPPFSQGARKGWEWTISVGPAHSTAAEAVRSAQVQRVERAQLRAEWLRPVQQAELLARTA